MRYQFFIAFAGADREAARRLCNALEALGQAVFFDERLEPGAEWMVEIPRALRESETVLALVSGVEQTEGPGHYARAELVAAIQGHRRRQKRVVPIYLQGHEVPLEVPFGLAGLHGLFLTEGPSAVAARLVGTEATTLTDAPPLASMVPSRPSAEIRLQAPQGRAQRPPVLAELAPGQVFAQRYELRERIGGGGFGQVWRAFDRQRRHLVALKVLHRDLSPRHQERFDAGLAQMSRLGHPHTVQILEPPQTHQGRRFVVLELMETDLAQALTAGRLPPERVPQLIQAVARALEHAHGLGVIHRDIKPGNILLTGFEPRLTDFDLVHIEDAGRQARTGALGTLAYIAPEVLRLHTAITPAADQFSLAMTAASLCHGQSPEHDPLFDVFEREAWLDGLGLPERVRAVLARGLARQPEQRWPGVCAMADALAAALAPPVLQGPAAVGEAGAAGASTPRTRLPTPLVVGPPPAAPSAPPASPPPSPALAARTSAPASPAAPAPPPAGPIAAPVAAAPSPGSAVDTSARTSTLSGLVLVPIPGGTFTMGSPRGAGADREAPPHRVTLSPFLMSTLPITQAWFQEVTGRNPAYHKGPQRPVEQIDWDEAIDFCNALSRRDGLEPAYDPARRLIAQANGYRLPTEAQWEYACRAGQPGRWSHGDDEQRLSEYAWFRRNASNQTQPVGGRKPNAFGLFDMHGNIWEWCWDLEGDYPHEAQRDPLGPTLGGCRVVRGGSARDAAADCRSASRNSKLPNSRSAVLGFRLVRWV